jgi:hypothetical protein
MNGLELALGVGLVSLGAYVLLTTRKHAEKWEREGHEPGRISLLKPEVPKASEIRLRGWLVGSLSAVLGLAAIIAAVR